MHPMFLEKLMDYIIKFFNGIDSCDDIKKLRTEIFIDEQHFKNEFDETDKTATHVVVYDKDIPIATGRTFAAENKSIYIIGRIAVTKAYRKKALGSFIVTNLEQYAYNNGAESCELSAQVRVKDFYKKLGYKEEGTSYLDEYCPHIKMIKSLKR